MQSGKSRMSLGNRSGMGIFMGSGTSLNNRSMSQISQKGSPTQHYRRQMARTEEMFMRVYDLNSFIHRGIDKFLDKQAVRDLINEWDNNDIFIGGEEEFFQNINEDLEESGQLNFSRQERKRFQSIMDRLNADDSTLETGTKIAIPSDSKLAKAVRNGMNNHSMKNGKHNGINGAGKPFSKPRSSLWSSFFSIVRIKVFNVKMRVKSARRRESELFATYP